MRPWKAEQLGGGYRVSSWAERNNAVEYADAVIAVSTGMATDVCTTYPYLDPPEFTWCATASTRSRGIRSMTRSARVDADITGVDPKRPIVAFVGRITRQKGVAHLVAAAHHFDPSIQLVLCAGAPDTPEIGAEIESSVAELSASRAGVYWVRDMLPCPGSGKSSPPQASSYARRCTNRSASSIRGHGL